MCALQTWLYLQCLIGDFKHNSESVKHGLDGTAPLKLYTGCFTVKQSRSHLIQDLEHTVLRMLKGLIKINI